MRGSAAAMLLTAELLLSEPPPVLQGGEAPTKLFIVHGSMNVSAAPAWVAKSQGFFRKYSFEVDPVFVIGGRAAQAMIAGQAPFGFIGVTHIANALTGGADLKMILGLTTTLHYVLLSRPAIKTMEDLRGKKVGIGTPAGPPSLAAYLALDHAGLHPQRDQIVLLQVGGVPERLSALQTGGVDAATVPPALAQTMMTNGYNVLLDIANAKMPFTLQVWSRLLEPSAPMARKWRIWLRRLSKPPHIFTIPRTKNNGSVVQRRIAHGKFALPLRITTSLVRFR